MNSVIATSETEWTNLRNVISAFSIARTGLMSSYGAEGIRTPDLFLAKEAFSRLNYGPADHFRFWICDFRFCGTVRSIENQQSKIKNPVWAFLDLNQRPFPYQRNALTN